MFLNISHTHTQSRCDFKIKSHKWRNFSACDKPGENVLAGIGVRKGAELSDDNTLLCDGSHVSISSDKPTRQKLQIMLGIPTYRQTKNF